MVSGGIRSDEAQPDCEAHCQRHQASHDTASCTDQGRALRCVRAGRQCGLLQRSSAGAGPCISRKPAPLSVWQSCALFMTTSMFKVCRHAGMGAPAAAGARCLK